MCYAVPAVSAIVTSIVWSRTKSIKAWWLNLMFLGGALFGIIDHLWNGELFLIGKDLVSDMLLGATITLGILITWLAAILTSKKNPTLSGYMNAQKS